MWQESKYAVTLNKEVVGFFTHFWNDKNIEDGFFIANRRGYPPRAFTDNDKVFDYIRDGRSGIINVKFAK